MNTVGWIVCTLIVCITIESCYLTYVSKQVVTEQCTEAAMERDNEKG